MKKVESECALLRGLICCCRNQRGLLGGKGKVCTSEYKRLCGLKATQL